MDNTVISNLFLGLFLFMFKAHTLFSVTINIVQYIIQSLKYRPHFRIL